MGTRRAGGGGNRAPRGGAVSRGARGSWYRRSPWHAAASETARGSVLWAEQRRRRRRVSARPGRGGLRPPPAVASSPSALWELCASSGFLLSPVPGCAAIIGAAGGRGLPRAAHHRSHSRASAIELCFLLTLVTLFPFPFRVDLR